jgi:glutathione S-transferase
MIILPLRPPRQHSNLRFDRSGSKEPTMARPIVYGPAMSPYVWSARLSLAEKGVAHELVQITREEFRQEPHLSRHPFGRVPAFEHDGFDLYETQAIVRYVDERFAGFPLQPTDLHEFSRMNQIMGIVDAYAWSAIAAGIAFNRLVAPSFGLPVDEAAVAAGVPRARLCLAEVARLQGEQAFLAGERVSLADVMVAPLLFYLSRTLEGEPLLAEQSGLQTWLRRIERRQSFQVTKPPGV